MKKPYELVDFDTIGRYWLKHILRFSADNLASTPELSSAQKLAAFPEQRLASIDVLYPDEITRIAYAAIISGLFGERNLASLSTAPCLSNTNTCANTFANRILAQTLSRTGIFRCRSRFSKKPKERREGPSHQFAKRKVANSLAFGHVHRFQ